MPATGISLSFLSFSTRFCQQMPGNSIKHQRDLYTICNYSCLLCRSTSNKSTASTSIFYVFQLYNSRFDSIVFTFLRLLKLSLNCTCVFNICSFCSKNCRNSNVCCYMLFVHCQCLQMLRNSIIDVLRLFCNTFGRNFYAFKIRNTLSH